jgi:hypothetical protein
MNRPHSPDHGLHREQDQGGADDQRPDQAEHPREVAGSARRRRQRLRRKAVDVTDLPDRSEQLR